MMFILRWPAILALLALVMVCAVTALGAAGLLANFDAPAVGVEQVDARVAQAQSAAEGSGAAEAGWIDVGLLGAAAVFFLISAIRLMRRTQGFWTWLFGFACFGGRWAWAQQQTDGGVLATVQGIDFNAYMQPAALAADTASAETQVGLLAVVLIVGLIIFIVDTADRAYWDKQGA
ncbi:MAG: hypothetical protein ACREH4_05425 [Vitreimonas sp.]